MAALTATVTTEPKRWRECRSDSMNWCACAAQGPRAPGSSTSTTRESCWKLCARVSGLGKRSADRLVVGEALEDCDCCPAGCRARRRRLYYRAHQARPLTDKDSIVLSDFTNTTGDSVFDDTLKQGLAVQLEQSPFLNLLSERRVNDTLKLMGRPAGDRLTPEVTREVCQRTSTKAMLAGSIAGLGSQYVIA